MEYLTICVSRWQCSPNRQCIQRRVYCCYGWASQARGFDIKQTNSHPIGCYIQISQVGCECWVWFAVVTSTPIASCVRYFQSVDERFIYSDFYGYPVLAFQWSERHGQRRKKSDRLWQWNRGIFGDIQWICLCLINHISIYSSSSVAMRAPTFHCIHSPRWSDDRSFGPLNVSMISKLR